MTSHQPTDTFFSGRGIALIVVAAFLISALAVGAASASAAIALLTTDTDTTNISSFSGLDPDILATHDRLSLLRGCTADQIIKLQNNGLWACDSDSTTAVTGAGAVILDLGDDDVDESAVLAEIATTGDTNSIFTEPTADKLLISLGNNWPRADVANTADALTTNPTDCAANQFADSIIASGNLGCNSIVDADVPNSITIDLAATATALAANPADCAANQFADSIIASGNLGCNAIVDADVPDTITIDLSATATALAANPTDCGANTKADSIVASGNLTCTGIDTGDIIDDEILEVDLDAVDAAVDEECLTFESSNSGFEWQTCGTGTSIILDLADDDVDESTALAEIATTGDTNSIFTEPTADKLLITLGNNWPRADVANTADALTANPTDCAANQFADSIVASGNLGCNAIVDADVPNTITIDLAATATALAADPSDCAANQFADSIIASGNLGCNAIVDADVPNSITIDLSATATALAANPSDCAADTKADAIDASGNLTCTAVNTGDITNSTILALDLNAVDAESDEECVTFEVSNGGFEFEDCVLGTSLSEDNLWIGDAGGVAVERTIDPACSDTVGQHLNYAGVNIVCGTTSSFDDGGTMTGTLTVTGAGNSFTLGFLDCTGNLNGGALTASAVGLVSCSDDDSGAGATGTVNSIEEADSQVGGSDIVTLDFGAGFDLTESPDTEINIALDVTEENLTEDNLWVGNGSNLATETAFSNCQAANQAVTYATGSQTVGCNTFYAQHGYGVGLTGTLTTSLDFEAVNVPITIAATIQDMTCRVGTAPTGATILIDLHLNGTTIFTTQANRVTIAISGLVDTSGTPDVTAISPGDRINFDIDQVGSTIAGADLSCVLNVRQALVNTT